jgi:NAD(P)-dependent dehydrogenase (short-subunit alcohol dehydrogenase family)
MRINQSNNNNWTVERIPDLSGKVIIVTGANTGIGYETAKEVARKCARTVLACRNLEKGEAALVRIKDEIPNASVEVIQLDLSSLASVRQFAEDFKAKYDRLDILINNAGIMYVPYGKTIDGFERHFGTNHLGHFALTGLLVDLLLKTENGRVVTVSSVGHRSGEMDFDDLMFEGGRGYRGQRVYGRSKLANLLFTYELQRRLEARGVDVIATAAHPGGSNTDLARHVENRWYFRLMRPLFEVVAQSAAMGALPSLRAAVDPDVKGGDYYGPEGFMESAGYPVLVQSSEASRSLEDARKLWEVSEELTEVQYL